MAPTVQYSTLSGSDDYHAPVKHRKEDSNGEATLKDSSIRRRHWRGYLTHAVALLLGVSLGLSVAEAWGGDTTAILASKSSTGEQNATVNFDESKSIESNGSGAAVEFHYSCGKSWQEAKARGCNYDLLAGKWYAKDCWNQNLYDGMMADSNLANSVEWFGDRPRTKPTTTRLALSGEHDMIHAKTKSGIDFHLIHCLYLWRQLHLAIVEHRPLDMDTYDYEHTEHCTRMFLNVTVCNPMQTGVRFAPSRCRSLPL